MNYLIREPLVVRPGEDPTSFEYWVGPDLDHWAFAESKAHRFASGPLAIRKQMELADFHREGTKPRQMEIVQAHHER